MTLQINVTRESAAVFVNVAVGEELIYRVTPRGDQPIFTLVDSESGNFQSGVLLMSQNDNPVETSPAVIFERRWPSPQDQLPQVTIHIMGFQFLGAISYRYEVLQTKLIGPAVTIMDITYSSTSPQAQHFQRLQVSTV